MKAILRTDAAISLTFLQSEFLPSNDTAFVYLYKTLKPPCSKVNNKATMMYFIGSFEYRVMFLVKIRRFNGHRKWTFCVLGQIFRQIVSIRVVTLINTNVVASRHIKREEVLLPVAVRRSRTPELKLNFIRGKENVTHSAQSEFSGRNGFFGGNFLFRISE